MVQRPCPHSFSRQSVHSSLPITHLPSSLSRFLFLSFYSTNYCLPDWPEYRLWVASNERGNAARDRGLILLPFPFPLPVFSRISVATLYSAAFYDSPRSSSFCRLYFRIRPQLPPVAKYPHHEKAALSSETE